MRAGETMSPIGPPTRFKGESFHFPSHFIIIPRRPPFAFCSPVVDRYTFERRARDNRPVTNEPISSSLRRHRHRVSCRVHHRTTWPLIEIQKRNPLLSHCVRMNHYSCIYPTHSLFNQSKIKTGCGRGRPPWGTARAAPPPPPAGSPPCSSASRPAAGTRRGRRQSPCRR